MDSSRPTSLPTQLLATQSWIYRMFENSPDLHSASDDEVQYPTRSALAGDRKPQLRDDIRFIRLTWSLFTLATSNCPPANASRSILHTALDQIIGESLSGATITLDDNDPKDITQLIENQSSNPVDIATVLALLVIEATEVIKHFNRESFDSWLARVKNPRPVDNTLDLLFYAHLLFCSETTDTPP